MKTATLNSDEIPQDDGGRGREALDLDCSAVYDITQGVAVARARVLARSTAWSAT